MVFNALEGDTKVMVTAYFTGGLFYGGGQRFRCECYYRLAASRGFGGEIGGRVFEGNQSKEMVGG